MQPRSCAAARILVKSFDAAAPDSSVVVRLAAAKNPAILDSSLRSDARARFSLFAADPAEVVAYPATQTRWFGRELAERFATFPRPVPDGPPAPFRGGWIGFLSYESGTAIEAPSIPPRTPGDRWPIPSARFALYDTAAVYDWTAQRWSLVAVDWPKTHRLATDRPPADVRLEQLRRRLESAGRHVDHIVNEPDAERSRVAGTSLTYGSYLEKVRRALDYIEAGDIYQVNLAQRFHVRTDLPSSALYGRLRCVNPSPFAAYLQWDAPRPAAIVSASPELFLELRHGRVVTRPIKGTRPRTGNAAVDAGLRRELIESGKDRAELNMIIDLLRNDLGRVCSYGTVRVTEAGAIEAHPTVFHRVATIEGRFDPGRSWIDLIEAAFPCGSVTGAPRIRAMQIIRELEPVPRGPYCGAIGCIGLDGNMTLSVAIRTMVQVGRDVLVCAGGAIVAESDPQREHEEIMAKAAGMLRALGVEDGDPCEHAAVDDGERRVAAT